MQTQSRIDRKPGFVILTLACVAVAWAAPSVHIQLAALTSVVAIGAIALVHRPH
jgi:hypothetical protein